MIWFMQSRLFLWLKCKSISIDPTDWYPLYYNIKVITTDTSSPSRNLNEMSKKNHLLFVLISSLDFDSILFYDSDKYNCKTRLVSYFYIEQFYRTNIKLYKTILSYNLRLISDLYISWMLISVRFFFLGG